MCLVPSLLCSSEPRDTPYTSARICRFPFPTLLESKVPTSVNLRAMNIHPNAGGFVIASGAILGICAGSCSSPALESNALTKGIPTPLQGFYGLLKAHSCWPTQPKARKVAISESSGPYSISVVSSGPQSRWVRTFTLKQTLVSHAGSDMDVLCSSIHVVGNGTYVR